METEEPDRFAEEEAYKLSILEMVGDDLLAHEVSSVVLQLHRVPATRYCAAVSISPDDDPPTEFLVYETEPQHLKILPAEFDWPNYSGIFPPPYWPIALEVERDCQEFYDHDSEVIDQSPLGVGDLLSVSGYIGEGGQVPQYEDYQIITEFGRCLSVMVTEPDGSEIVVYKSWDGKVKTIDTTSQ